MNSLLTPYHPPVYVIVLGFVVTIGLAWLLSYTRRGEVRSWIWGRRKVRAPRPPVVALDPALPVRVAVLKLRASRAQRMETFLCDVIFLALVIFAVLLLAGWAAGGEAGVFVGVTRLLGDQQANEMGTFLAVAGIVLFVFLYYVVLEARFGRTVGKFVAGTRVVDLDGCGITLGQAIGRTLCRRLTAEPLSLLFLNDKYGGRSAWHDAIPGTVVIRTRAVPEADVADARKRSFRRLGGA